MGTASLILVLLLAAPQEEPRPKMPNPTWITMKAGNRPLNEVLQEISREASIPIDCPGVTDRVTVNLSEATFWQALDGVCKAHGQIRFFARGDKVLVGRGTYPDNAVLFSGPLAVFAGGTRGSLVFGIFWEKRVPVDGVGYRVSVLRDGVEVTRPVEAEEAVSLAPAFHDSALSHTLIIPVPQEGRDREGTSRLKVVLRCRMALGHSEIVFKDPERKMEARGSTSRVSVRLVRFAREGGKSQISYEVSPGELPPQGPTVLKIVALDEKGVEHAVGRHLVRFKEGDPRPVQSPPFLGLPASFYGPVGELKILVPEKVHVEELNLDPDRIQAMREDRP